MAKKSKKKGEPDEPFIPQPYLPADAVAREAQPGYKAGNPLIDEVNKNIRRENIIKKFRKFYDNFVKRKK